jgi:hypothetical protein
MNYFQMMLTQHLKGILQRRVIKLIFIFGFVSCTALRTSNDNYKVINSLVNTYVEKDSIYLYPKIITLTDKIINEFKTQGIDINKCNDEIHEVISDKYEESLEKINIEEKWNYAKIKNPKVFTYLELKLPSSLKRYEKLSETIKDEYALLDRKFMLWRFEHNCGMLRLSYPFFNKDRTHALVYVSKYNDGEFVLLLKKETKKKWNVICEKRLSHY